MFREFGSRTRFLEIDGDDWVTVKRGIKREFRQLTLMRHVACPMLVVAHCLRPYANEPETCLLTVEETWREPVGAISPESLQREGFPDIANFRRYWMAKTGTRFRPLDEVQVFRVAPFDTEDVAKLGRQLILNLYGPYLPDGLVATLRGS